MANRPRTLTLGKYEFHFPRGADYTQQSIAHEWAYNLQHQFPATAELTLQIKAYKIAPPITLIPTEANSIPPHIAEPAHYAVWDRQAQNIVNMIHRSLYIAGEPTPPFPPEEYLLAIPLEPIVDEHEWGTTPTNTIVSNPALRQIGGGGICFRQKFKQTALQGLVQDVGYEPVHRPQKHLVRFIESAIAKVRPDLKAALKIVKGLSFWISVQVQYLHPAKPKADQKSTYLHSGKRRIINDFELDEKLEDIKQAILLRNSNYNRESSGLVLDEILGFRFRICEFQPLRGHCHQELPPFLQLKHCIINVKNTDTRCFGYAVISALENQTLHANRPAHYDDLFATYGLENVNYPVAVSDIPQLEDLLQLNINVYSFYDDQGRARYPLYVSKKKHPQTIDLLFWDEHYAWIKSFPALMSDLVKKHTLHWCRACLGHFDNARSLETHKHYCEGVDDCGQIFVLPEEFRKVRFQNLAYVQITVFDIISHLTESY